MQRGAAAAIAAIATAIAGCDAVLGIRDLPRSTREDASAPFNGFEHASTTCGDCVATQCLADRESCAADLPCRAMYTCVAKCAPGDVACRATCEAADGPTLSAAPFAPFDRCRRKSCGAQCYGGAGFGVALDSKCKCVDKVCSAEMLACVRSDVNDAKALAGACERKMTCLSRAPNPDAYIDCMSPVAGTNEAIALLDCFRRNACESCPLASGALACVGAFQYARSRHSDVKFTLRAQDHQEKPVVGATVVACGAGKCSPCLEVFKGKTDANGKLTMTLPVVDGAFQGCFEVVPPGETAFNTLVFAGRPIRRDEDILATITLDRTIIAFYAGLIGKAADATRGHVIASLHDCIWGRVEGAEVDLTDNEGAERAYLKGDAIVEGGTATTTSGTVAFLNVKPGRHEIFAKKGGVEIARMAIDVVADRLTDANIYPRPR